MTDHRPAASSKTGQTTTAHPRSSRQRFRKFVQDYKLRQLDDSTDALKGLKPAVAPEPDPAPGTARRGRRKEYLREYFRWLWPHRYGVAALFLLPLLAAPLDMLA